MVFGVSKSFSQRYEILTINATRLFERLINEQRSALIDHLQFVAAGQTVEEMRQRAADRPEAIRPDAIVRDDQVSDIYDQTLKEIAFDPNPGVYTRHAQEYVAAAVERGEDEGVAKIRALIEHSLYLGEPGVWTGSLTPVTIRGDREVG